MHRSYLLLLFLSFFGCSFSSDPGGLTRLSVSHNSTIISSDYTIDMGIAQSGTDTVNTTIILFNSGTIALTINSISLTKSSIGFNTSSGDWPCIINPGRSIPITITFSPQSTGSFSTALMIYSEKFNINELTFPISGIGSVDPVVSAPRPDNFLPIVPPDTRITFTSQTAGAILKTGISTNNSASQPDSWETTSDIVIGSEGSYLLFAQASKTAMHDSAITILQLSISNKFPAAADAEGSDAMFLNDPQFTCWADGTDDISIGFDVTPPYQNQNLALGPATGSSTDCLSLGNHGSITLTFPHVIVNGPGNDFAVFENSFSDTFLELAYVAVSSNGSDFVTFDSISKTASAIDAFGMINTEDIYGLAGRYRVGFGTPFDLQLLAHKTEVIDGSVDLYNIQYIKILDIAGNEALPTYHFDYDSFNHEIFDPFKTVGSAGFDLEAVGVVNCL